MAPRIPGIVPPELHGPPCALCLWPVGPGAPGRTLHRDIDGLATVHNDTHSCEAFIDTMGGKGRRTCRGCHDRVEHGYVNYLGVFQCWPCANGEKQTVEAETGQDAQECAAPDEPRTTVYGVDITEWDNRWREMERRLGDISGGMLRLLLAIEASRE